ncbi:MAG: MarR family winged helix-turn-helix transcriptional regulator [Streptosporangiaceae bacterium]
MTAPPRPGGAVPWPPSQPASRHAAAEQSPGFLLWRATLCWQRGIRSALAPHGLTHVQFVLLASLWWLAEHSPRPPSQAALAAHAGTDPMMTSQVIRKLAERGLAQRRPDPADSRARQLALTDAGRTLLAGALANVEAADESFFAALGSGRAAFLRQLGELAQAAERGG